MKRFFQVLGAIILILIAIFIYKEIEKKEVKKKEVLLPAIPVEVIPVKRGDLVLTLSLNGTIRPKREVNLFFKIPGKVKSIYVEEGDRVSPGQVLATLESHELQAQVCQAKAALNMAEARLAQAKAGLNLQTTQTDTQIEQAKQNLLRAKDGLEQAEINLENAKIEFERMKTLFEEGAGSKQQYDLAKMRYDLAKSSHNSAQSAVKQAEEALKAAESGRYQNKIRKEDIDVAEAAVEQARAALEYAKSQLYNTILRSPIEGIITHKGIEVGETVAAKMGMGGQQGVFTITDNSDVYVETEVSERDLKQVSPGKKVKVQCDALPGETYWGNISTVLPSANPRSRCFIVKVKIPNPGKQLKSGMFARLEMISQKFRDVLLIPREAVLEVEGKKAVFVAEGKVARLKEVKTSVFNESQIIIQEGLSEWEAVVVKGQQYLKDNSPIIIAGGDKK